MNESNQTRKFYVTGASGFIGRRLCGRLAAAGRVRALFRSAVPAGGPWASADVVDLTNDEVPEGALAGVDTVFHLAARTHAVDEHGDVGPAYERINVDGTKRVLEAARRAGVKRFVFFSSVKAMGEGGDSERDESTPPAPSTWYGRTKLAAERLVLTGGYVPEPVVLRPVMVYGPGAKGNLERMIDAVGSGKFPPVPRVDNRRSVVHVDDVAAAAVLAATAPAAPGRVFIVTDGRPCSTREMYEWICDALGKTPPRWTVPLAVFRALSVFGDAVGKARGRRWAFDSDAYDKMFGSACYDSSSIETTLGFEPQWNFRSALPHLIESRSRAAGSAG
jgi:nucleoside-diphosphate-sugar epimerase